MNSLYLENSIIGSLFRFFSPYFSTATRPTRFLLTWLVIAQVALQAFPSLRFLHRNSLSQVTHRCLNSYYRALQNETVTSRSLRRQTAQLACSLIPAALQNEPVFLSVDDTTVSKFGKKFDAVSLLHDHACHTGKPYVIPDWTSSVMSAVIRQCMRYDRPRREDCHPWRQRTLRPDQYRYAGRSR